MRSELSSIHLPAFTHESKTVEYADKYDRKAVFIQWNKQFIRSNKSSLRTITDINKAPYFIGAIRRYFKPVFTGFTVFLINLPWFDLFSFGMCLKISLFPAVFPLSQRRNHTEVATVKLIEEYVHLLLIKNRANQITLLPNYIIRLYTLLICIHMY